MSRLPESPDQTDAILTLEDASALFGVSVKTFIKLLREEDVPARKIGREWRFSREALLRWLGGGHSRQYSDSEQETRRFFDAIATGYDASQDHAFEASLLSELEQHSPPPAEGLCLDYGTGTGLIAQWIAGRQGRVLALDVSSGMLGELNRQATAKNLGGISTRLCEIGEVPVEARSIACVYASLCLHHVPDPAQTLRELYRALRHGGVAAIVEYFPYTDESWQDTRHDAWPGLDPDVMSGWMADAGYQNMRVVWEQPTPEGRRAYLLLGVAGSAVSSS